MKKTPFYLLILWMFLGCMFIACKPGSEEASEGRPNFIIYYTDELQFDDISAYGGSINTPGFDKLASDGIRFDQAYTAASMCTPSRYALLTGQFPGRCQHPGFLRQNPEDEPYSIAWNTFLTPETITLPKRLKEAGYFTGMAGKWHQSSIPDSVTVPEFDKEEDPTDPETQRKLKRYQEVTSNLIARDGGFDRVYSGLFGNYDAHPVKALHVHNFPWITYGAIQFLEEAAAQDKPFFLYMTPTAIHGPNHVNDLDHDVSVTPEGILPDVLDYQLHIDSVKSMLDTMSRQKAHRVAGMAQMEEQLRRLRSALDRLQLTDNTVIWFMADHNIEPGKATNYQKGIHVPMIVYWPGLVEGGRTSNQLIENVDVMPTLLQAAGWLSDNTLNDGYSFYSVWQGEGQYSPRSYVISEAGYARAITDGSWKYQGLRFPHHLIEIMQQDSMEYAYNYMGSLRQAHSSIAMQHFPHYFDPDQLYNLSQDPYEQVNLYGQHPNLADSLRKQLKAYTGTLSHPYPWEDTTFLYSAAYQEKAQKTKAIGTGYIPWLSRDHGAIVFPPKK